MAGPSIEIEHADVVIALRRRVRELEQAEAARRHAEKALRESEARFRAFTENTTDITVVLNQDHVFTYASPSAERIIGYTPAEIVGRTPYDFVLSEDKTIASNALHHAAQTPGETLRVPRFRSLHKDGRILHLEGLITNLLSVQGVSGLVVNCRDVTERILAEAELHKSEELYWAPVPRE